MRLPLFLFGSMVVMGCGERTPPAGSGALETTPVGSAARTAAPPVVSMPAAIPFPNGSVLATDPKRCRIAFLHDGATQWDREVSGCGGLLEATIAMDSTVYVRTQRELVAFSHEGTPGFTAKLLDAPPPHALAAPTALADSRVAIAATPKSVVVYERDGKFAWTFSPPSDELLIAPPVGNRTEGLILMTSQAVYYLGATGETRWRAAQAAPIAP